MSGRRQLIFALPENNATPEALQEYYERALNPTLLRVRHKLYEMNNVEARDPDRILDIVWDLETAPKPRLLVEIESRKPQHFYNRSHEQGRFATKIAGVFQTYMEMEGFVAVPGLAAEVSPSERVTRQVFFKVSTSDTFDPETLRPKLEQIRSDVLRGIGTDLNDPAKDREISWGYFAFGKYGTFLQVDIHATKETESKGMVAAIFGSRAEREVKWAADLLRALVEVRTGAKKIPNETAEAMFLMGKVSQGAEPSKGRG